MIFFFFTCIEFYIFVAMNEYSFSIISLLRIIKIRWKVVIVTTLIAGIIGGVFAFSLKNYYKATCSVYVLDYRAMVASSVLSTTEYEDNKFTPLGGSNLRLGSPDDVDQAIGTIVSEKVKMQVVKDFNIYQRYGIQENSPKSRAKVLGIIDDNLKVKRSGYNTIEITVWETEPELSKNMANRFVELANTIYSGLLQKNMEKTYSLMEAEYLRKSKEVKQLEDSLNLLKKTKNNPAHEMVLDKLLMSETHQLANLKHAYEISALDKTHKLNTITTLDEAQANDKKDKPKRSLIILGFLLSGFGMGVCIAAILEKLK